MKDFIIVDGDLAAENGDFKIGDARLDLVERIAIANKGEFKMSPQSGCAMVKVLGGNTTSGNAFKVALIEDLARNGIEYDSIEMTEEGFEIKLKD